MIKEWRNVKGYEKLYRVSNYGEVRAKRKVIYDFIDGELQPSYIRPECTLTPTDNGNGYLIVGLVNSDGQRVNHYVHRLVAEAFLENPNNLPQVNHIDYDRQNNKLNNLEWVSAKDNVQHSLCNQPKTKCSHSRTGYKYVYFRNDKYRVCLIPMNGKRKEKTFTELPEALKWRDRLAKEYGVVIDDNGIF